MKKLFCTIAIIMTILISGCGIDEEIETPPEPEKPAEVVVKPEPAPEPSLDNGKYILADDDFSNLQLDEVDKPVYDRYGVWDRQERGLPMALPEIEPYRAESVAYLTFDDGPDDKITPKILDVLKQENVKATFFVLGNMAEKYPKVLKRIFDEGHQIGNHSYNHVYKDLYKSPWDFVEQFMKTDDIIMEYTGVRPLVIRAPGGVAGVFNQNYWEMVNACGYAEYDWNISTEDATASKPNSSTQVNNVIKQLGTQPPHSIIILMHSKDGKDETVKALPELITMLRNWGYKFGVVTPMTPQPW